MHEWQIESLHVFDDFIKEGSQFYDSTILDLLLTTSAVLAVAARHLTIFLGHRMTTALRSRDSPDIKMDSSSYQMMRHTQLHKWKSIMLTT